MVEENKNEPHAVNTRKRFIMTSELGNKYKSKADFVKVFKENCKCISLHALLVNSVAVRPAGHDDQ